MKQNISLALSVFCCLTACTSTINMPLDHAKLADGYINSSTLDFGHVLVWDTVSNRVGSIYRIAPNMVPSANVDSGPRYRMKDSSISRDTKIELSAAPVVSEAAKGEATAQFINSTDVCLTNYNPREFRDARYVLNSPELREWRQSLSEEYTGPQYRFIFISRVTDGEKIQIGRESSGSAGAAANVVQVGQFKFKVTYNNKTSATIEAEQAPLTVNPSIFSFHIQGDSYRFYRDLNTPFNFQSLKNS